MSTLVYCPEAEAEAAKFGVPPQIHTDDFIYQWLLDVPWGGEPDRNKARARVAEYYFADGDQSARRLDDLIRQHHPAASRKLSLLEFASGYGRVSRHLRAMDDRYDVVACDIHPNAVAFLRDQIGVNAVSSCTDPRDFDAQGKFDVVFALSFFTHMPHRTFAAWIKALLAALADDGLLIFTTHGRIVYEGQSCPALEPEGYWFAAGSEQQDISTDEYGVSITTPFYVMEQIAHCPHAAVVLFREALWWEQDLFLVKKVRSDFRPQRALADNATSGAHRRALQPTLASERADESALPLAQRHAAELAAAVETVRTDIEALRTTNGAGYSMAVGRSQATSAADLTDASPLELAVDFGRYGNSAKYCRQGWRAPEPTHTWTSGPSSRLELPRPWRPGRYLLQFDLVSPVERGRSEAQLLAVLANGTEIGKCDVRERVDFRCPIEWNLIEASPTLRIDLHHPNAAQRNAHYGASGETLAALGVATLNLIRIDEFASVAGEGAPPASEREPEALERSGQSGTSGMGS